MSEVEDSLKKIAKGTIIIFIGLFLSKFLAYLFRVIIARLGPEKYGLFSLAVTIFGILTAISIFALNEGVIRYVSYYKGKNDNEKIKGTIISAIKISIPISIAITLIVILLSKQISINLFHEPRLIQLLILIVIAIPIANLGEIFISALKGFQKVTYIIYTKNIIENIVKIALVLIFIKLGFDILGAILAYIIGITTTLILSFYFLQTKVFQIIKSKINAIELKKEITSYSWPLLLNTLMLLIIFWTDTLMLGYFKSLSDVGIYNAASPTAQLMNTFPYALTILFLPVLTELYAQNKKDIFEKIYKSSTRWLLIINLILLYIFLFFPVEILKLFGSKYTSGYNVIIILSVSYLVYNLTLTTNNILMIYKKTKMLFINSLVAAISNVILNIILIPKYNILGAAIASGISYLIITILLIIENQKIVKINPFSIKDFICIAFSFLIPVLITKLTINKVKINILSITLFVIFFLIVYFILLLLTKSLKKEDINIIKSMIAKLPKKPSQDPLNAL